MANTSTGNDVSEKKITFRLAVTEFEALEEWCKEVQRTKTELLREFIRTLPTYKPPEGK